MQFEIRPLRGPLGAEVLGADPSTGIEAGRFEEILGALREYRLLLFRGAPRSNEQLASFARRFGSVIEFFDQATEPGHPEILRIANIEEDGRPIGITGSVELPWHADYAYRALPGKESFLEAVEVPEAGSTTSFIDMCAAYDTLPPALKERIRGRQAIHRPKLLSDDQEEDYFDLRDETNRGAQAQLLASEAIHPMAARHPETERVALYISPIETTEIVGASEEEARELFSALFEHTIRPERIYEHAWSPGDLVAFDTFGTMHHRDAFDPAGRRYMRQLSTLCEAAPASA